VLPSSPLGNLSMARAKKDAMKERGSCELDTGGKLASGTVKLTKMMVTIVNKRRVLIRVRQNRSYKRFTGARVGHTSPCLAVSSAPSREVRASQRLACFCLRSSRCSIWSNLVGCM